MPLVTNNVLFGRGEAKETDGEVFVEVDVGVMVGFCRGSNGFSMFSLLLYCGCCLKSGARTEFGKKPENRKATMGQGQHGVGWSMLSVVGLTDCDRL